MDMLRRILDDYGRLPITSAYANPEWGGARGLVYFTDHEAALAALAVDGTPAPEPRTSGRGAIHHEAWTRDGLVLITHTCTTPMPCHPRSTKEAPNE
ncbi:hypothetical protein ACH0CA_01255 [Kytococcus sedentarius]|uniref:hypothetical protein n=1 Tax=Kytococcus sedentarius TaxID=1276 RepID=UPI00387A4518